MTKVLIRGTQSHESIGVHAMTICTMKILDKFIPEVEFILFSPIPENDIGLYNGFGFNFKVVKYLGGSKRMLFRLFRAFLWKILNKVKIDAKRLLNDDILRTIYESDIVIDMLGDAFSYDIGEFGGNISSIAHSLDILLATSLGKDVVLFPQSIGPFRNKLVKLLAKFSLNRAKVIVVREELSKNYLEDIGVNKPEIYLTADTAFILEPASDKRVYEMLSKGGLENDNTPLIGINISQLLNYKSKNLAIKEDYIALMAKLADYLVENLNVNIIFVPHEITPYKTTTEIENRIALIGGDDINAVKEAYEKVKNKEKVIPIVDRDVLLLN